MKRQIIFMLLTVFCAMGTFAQSKFFEKCEKIKGVTTVYVSKAMLQMAGDANVTDDMNLSAVIKKPNSLELINAESPASVVELNKLIKELNINQKNGYEIMMSVNDDEQNVKIYMKKMANNTNEYVILVEESDEVLVVLMNGTLTLDEAAKAVKVGDKKGK
ncbi:DUF4252 domain-containing protein [uncultured Muribaculum sp.]|uniref:DUF4252 domain-containing protein n=1 Tax=uncultured Muribaculum sp. TaxID=1918613 RepID=UPI00265B1D63|nr:DUF4252 domain-containing protein [uncultured Muribaculum sp.]